MVVLTLSGIRHDTVKIPFESQEILSIWIKIVLTVLLDFEILEICEFKSLWYLARLDKVLGLWDFFFLSGFSKSENSSGPKHDFLSVLCYVAPSCQYLNSGTTLYPLIHVEPACGTACMCDAK